MIPYMPKATTPPPRHGPPTRGITAGDVEHAADALLGEGHRPTIEKIREKIGRGSPNTINPLLDAWWKKLSGRLDAGPAAFHRLPESVAHVAEALWMQALDEGRRRAALEQRSAERAAAADRQSLEVRSHVLSLREGELESRLGDRERTQATLESQLGELTLLLRKGEATRDAQTKRIAALEDQLLAQPKKPAMPRNSSERPVGRSRAYKRAGRGETPNEVRRFPTKKAHKRPPPKRSPSTKRRR
jgi:hypothetical protein